MTETEFFNPSTNVFIQGQKKKSKTIIWKYVSCLRATCNRKIHFEFSKRLEIIRSVILISIIPFLN